jgi:hypothetical protein
MKVEVISTPTLSTRVLALELAWSTLRGGPISGVLSIILGPTEPTISLSFVRTYCVKPSRAGGEKA